MKDLFQVSLFKIAFTLLIDEICKLKEFFKEILIITKKYVILKIQKAINLYKLHIILLLEIAKKVGESSHKVGTKKSGESSHKLEFEKAVFPTIKLELKKGGAVKKLP